MEPTREGEQGEPPAAVVPAIEEDVGTTTATRRERNRRIDLGIVVLLGVASLLAAWAGHQSGLWTGKQAEFITKAETAQIEATRRTTNAYQVMQIDVAVFMGWLNANQQGNSELATFYRDRFTTHLRLAFDAWLATDPLTSTNGPPDPFRMAAYQIPQLQAANTLDEQAATFFADANRASATGEAYVLATILLALVLFLGGVSAKIVTRSAQFLLLAVALFLLLFTIQKLGTLPDGTSWGLTPRWG